MFSQDRWSPSGEVSQNRFYSSENTLHVQIEAKQNLHNNSKLQQLKAEHIRLFANLKMEIHYDTETPAKANAVCTFFSAEPFLVKSTVGDRLLWSRPTVLDLYNHKINSYT